MDARASIIIRQSTRMNSLPWFFSGQQCTPDSYWSIATLSSETRRSHIEFLHLSEHHDVTYCYVMLCFDIDFILDDMDSERCKVLFSPVHRLHSLLPPVKSNPYGLRSRDHDLQLPVCNNFSRRLSLLFYVVFLDLNTILLCLYSFLIAIFFIFTHALVFILPFLPLLCHCF